jgi:hypothetical protein
MDNPEKQDIKKKTRKKNSKNNKNKQTNKHTTQYMFDITIRKQTQIRQISQDPSTLLLGKKPIYKVRSKSTEWKTNNLKIYGTKKAKVTNYESQNQQRSPVQLLYDHDHNALIIRSVVYSSRLKCFIRHIGYLIVIYSS